MSMEKRNTTNYLENCSKVSSCDMYEICKAQIAIQVFLIATSSFFVLFCTASFIYLCCLLSLLDILSGKLLSLTMEKIVHSSSLDNNFLGSENKKEITVRALTSSLLGIQCLRPLQPHDKRFLWTA